MAIELNQDERELAQYLSDVAYDLAIIGNIGSRSWKLLEGWAAETRRLHSAFENLFWARWNGVVAYAFAKLMLSGDIRDEHFAACDGWTTIGTLPRLVAREGLTELDLLSLLNVSELYHRIIFSNADSKATFYSAPRLVCVSRDSSSNGAYVMSVAQAVSYRIER
jgi:hypothetical protein